MVYTIIFENLDKRSLPVVGGKNASLGELIKAGIRVPPGFAVTTAGYLNFITAAGIANRIADILSGLNVEDIPLVFAPEHRARFGFVDGIQDAHSLVMANGGRIWIESEKGVGNNFIVLLPLKGDLLTMDATAGVTSGKFELNVGQAN